MDLGAYAQIDRIEEIAKKNGIEVPRLRGYRLMSEEQPTDYTHLLHQVGGECVDDLARSCWRADRWSSTFNEWTDYLVDWYTRKLNGGGREPRWNRIHGFKRKKLKFEIKKQKRAITKQYETFNKYCGRYDILYIHARIGGGNWSYYRDQVINQPWFIEKVDDAYDSTYCDIYARLEPIEKGE